MSRIEFIEKRRVQRVALQRPAKAFVAGIPMFLVELSTTGARVEHDIPLGIRREMKLRFDFDGATLVLTCVVQRCRLQRSASRPDAVAYSSGLRFTLPEEPSRAALRAIVGSLLGASGSEQERSAPTLPAV